MLQNCSMFASIKMTSDELHVSSNRLVKEIIGSKVTSSTSSDDSKKVITKHALKVHKCCKNKYKLHRKDGPLVNILNSKKWLLISYASKSNRK